LAYNWCAVINWIRTLDLLSMWMVSFCFVVVVCLNVWVLYAYILRFPNFIYRYNHGSKVSIHKHAKFRMLKGLNVKILYAFLHQSEGIKCHKKKYKFHWYFLSKWQYGWNKMTKLLKPYTGPCECKGQGESKTHNGMAAQCEPFYTSSGARGSRRRLLTCLLHRLHVTVNKWMPRRQRHLSNLRGYILWHPRFCGTPAWVANNWLHELKRRQSY